MITKKGLLIHLNYKHQKPNTCSPLNSNTTESFLDNLVTKVFDRIDGCHSKLQVQKSSSTFVSQFELKKERHLAYAPQRHNIIFGRKYTCQQMLILGHYTLMGFFFSFSFFHQLNRNKMSKQNTEDFYNSFQFNGKKVEGKRGRRDAYISA